MSQLDAEQQGDDKRLPNANEIGMGDEQDAALTLIRRTQIQSIKGVRSQGKSSVTRSITKLNKLLQEQGSRKHIRALVAKIESQVQSADSFNRQLYALLPENEHEQTQKWFMDVSHKAESAIVEAHAHLERRADEEPLTVLSGFAT